MIFEMLRNSDILPLMFFMDSLEPPTKLGLDLKKSNPATTLSNAKSQLHTSIQMLGVVDAGNNTNSAEAQLLDMDEMILLPALCICNVIRFGSSEL